MTPEEEIVEGLVQDCIRMMNEYLRARRPGNDVARHVRRAGRPRIKRMCFSVRMGCAQAAEVGRARSKNQEGTRDMGGSGDSETAKNADIVGLLMRFPRRG
jgi:hypothetical protein